METNKDNYGNKQGNENKELITGGQKTETKINFKIRVFRHKTGETRQKVYMHIEFVCIYKLT